MTPNHQSYLDVILLSSLLPLVFVAKAEVARWPLIGFLMRRGEQLTVRRRRSKGIKQTLQDIESRLAEKQNVCVFLEGTSSGENRVHRFFSPLLQAVLDQGAPVVPTAIRWACSEPGVHVADDIAYWKDHSFPSHLWRFLGLKGVHAVVTFGPAVPSVGKTRQALALELWKHVSELYGGPKS
jgi:1-acyl-sn-glycerol-3-phosphate acyltransferase